MLQGRKKVPLSEKIGGTNCSLCDAAPVVATLPKGWSLKTARDIAEQYLAYLRAHSAESKHVVDEMPEDFRHLGLIHSILLNAKIIPCVRKPVDTCLSLYIQHLSDALRYKWDLDGLVSWHKTVPALDETLARRIGPGFLVWPELRKPGRQSETDARKLFNILGCEWAEAVLDFHKSNRMVFTASKRQVRQRVYTTINGCR